MNLENLEHMKAWFETYVAGFYTNDSMYNRTIRLKEIIDEGTGNCGRRDPLSLRREGRRREAAGIGRGDSNRPRVRRKRSGAARPGNS